MRHVIMLTIQIVVLSLSMVSGADWAGFWLLQNTLDGQCQTAPAYKTWTVSKIEDCAGKCLQEYPSCRSANFDGSRCEVNAKNDLSLVSNCAGKKYLPIVSKTKDLSSVTLSTDPSGYTCESGWSIHKQSCFLYQDSATTLDKASQRCRLYLGNTASLENIEEHYFVSKMVPKGVNYVYIGFLRGAYDSGHYWSDGSNATYTSWADEAALSDSAYQSLICVRMSRELSWNWDMVACSETLPFICKKPGVK